MPRWTEDQLREYQQRREKHAADTAAYSHAGTAGLRSSPELQKQEVNLPPQDNKAAVHRDTAREKAVDAKSHARYRLDVVFRVSDNRVRDNSGMLETICDVLVAARRSLAGSGVRKHQDDPRSEG